MTREELLGLPHLATTEIANDNVYLSFEIGYLLTDFIDNGDYYDYKAYNCMYLPIQEEYPEYIVITKEEHQVNEEKRRMEILKREEEKIKEYKDLFENVS